MNGEFLTRNQNVAAYVLAIGGPVPVCEDLDQGYFTFRFADESGEWKRVARELDLSDTETDKCHVPAARLFTAISMIRDMLNEKRGRRRP